MRKLLIVGLLACLPMLSWAQRPVSCGTLLHPGELLFHVTGRDNKITDVTTGAGGMKIDHVAICLNADSVVEATTRGGVVVTPIDSLLSQQGYYIRGVVSGIDVRQSLANARSYIGKPYDYLYLSGDDSIYCSELVQKAFVDSAGMRVFAPVPMSFHNAKGEILAYWKEFYRRYGMEVPEGAPGTNPGEMSRRKNVRLIH